ncbi:MAG: hypothetical protein JWO71_3121 [Candidatus Acidoferrum typicum]|nr:hypothetical protein [Candidatus Acidoferrum typicum]
MESAKAEDYTKLMDEAAEELNAMHGGDSEYMKWLARVSPLMHASMHGIGCAIFNRGADVLPLTCFRTQLRVYIAMHAHAFEMHKHRAFLEALGKPIPPGLM